MSLSHNLYQLEPERLQFLLNELFVNKHFQVDNCLMNYIGSSRVSGHLKTTFFFVLRTVMQVPEFVFVETLSSPIFWYNLWFSLKSNHLWFVVII